MSNIHIIIAIAFFVLLGGFFSGAETGIYRLSKFRLRLGLHKQRKRFGILEKLMADSRGLIFSTLIGNNIANYLATTLLTWFFLGSQTSAVEAEFYSVVIMVPVLFVIGDLLPKNIFYYRADTLMPLIAGPAYVMHRFFTLSGMVPALKFFSNCFNFLAQTPAADSAPQRQYIRQMVHDTREEGVLSPVQVDIIERLINIPSIQLASVMVPIANVRMISITANRPALQEIITQTHFRYFPVYRASRTDIAGLIDLYQVLNTNEPFDTIERFVKPLVAVSADSRIIEALNRMRNEHLEMILVCRYDRAGHCVPIGIATIRDLVEELIGEWAQW